MLVKNWVSLLYCQSYADFDSKSFHSDNYVYYDLNWWFAYDIIKNMIMQIMIHLLQILICPVRQYNVSLYPI